MKALVCKGYNLFKGPNVVQNAGIKPIVFKRST